MAALRLRDAIVCGLPTEINVRQRLSVLQGVLRLQQCGFFAHAEVNRTEEAPLSQRIRNEGSTFAGQLLEKLKVETTNTEIRIIIPAPPPNRQLMRRRMYRDFALI